VPGTATIRAAGVLCWRADGDDVRVLLVRRTEYKDVSLPKGKVDPGELLPETAVRELLEETGIRATLGAPIGHVRYTVGGKPKDVQYWAAEVVGHQIESARFVPNDEIAAVEWVPIAQAKKLVSYPYDAEMIGTLQQRLKKGHARTFAIVVARHGKAVPPSAWDGPDDLRPLLHRGAMQARRIAPSIAAFGVERIVASPALRCRATMEPLARLIRLPIKAARGISQDAFEDGTAKPAEQIAKRLKRRRNVVLCSHGPVIPLLADAIRAGTGARHPGVERASTLSTGEFAVFHIAAETERPRLVDVEIHSAG